MPLNGEYPSWYREWRHDAVHMLQAKNDRLKAEFRIDDWPRYDYNLDAGSLIFSENGVAKVIADVEFVGSTSIKAGDWLWAWANSHWSPDLLVDSLLARTFGEEHAICELTHESVEDDDLNALGWELTSLTARISDALGAYRPPRDEGGGLYLIYKTMQWAA
jgi:hypothetical protein